MAKSKRKRVPKTVLKLPDLEQSKSAVLSSLTSASSKRSYDPRYLRIHRLVLLETSPRVQQDGGHTLPNRTRTALMRPVDDQPKTGRDTATGV
jgi:hypothetical protein